MGWKRDDDDVEINASKNKKIVINDAKSRLNYLWKDIGSPLSQMLRLFAATFPQNLPQQAVSSLNSPPPPSPATDPKSIRPERASVAATSEVADPGWERTDRLILINWSQMTSIPPPIFSLQCQSLIMFFFLPNFLIQPPLHFLSVLQLQLWLKQRAPDRSITNLHSQQSVTDSMPTKPLAIHYREAVQGEACPTAAC